MPKDGRIVNRDLEKSERLDSTSQTSENTQITAEVGTDTPSHGYKNQEKLKKSSSYAYKKTPKYKKAREEYDKKRRKDYAEKKAAKLKKQGMTAEDKEFGIIIRKIDKQLRSEEHAQRKQEKEVKKEEKAKRKVRVKIAVDPNSLPPAKKPKNSEIKVDAEMEIENLTIEESPGYLTVTYQEIFLTKTNGEANYKILEHKIKQLLSNSLGLGLSEINFDLYKAMAIKENEKISSHRYSPNAIAIKQGQEDKFLSLIKDFFKKENIAAISHQFNTKSKKVDNQEKILLEQQLKMQEIFYQSLDLIVDVEKSTHTLTSNEKNIKTGKKSCFIVNKYEDDKQKGRLFYRLYAIAILYVIRQKYPRKEFPQIYNNDDIKKSILQFFDYKPNANTLFEDTDKPVFEKTAKDCGANAGKAFFDELRARAIREKAGKSVYDIYSSDDELLKSIIDAAIVLAENRGRITWRSTLRELFFRQGCATFRPITVKQLLAYLEFIGHTIPANSMIDSCNGFGTRALGAFLSGVREVVACDPNDDVVKMTAKMFDELRERTEVKESKEIDPDFSYRGVSLPFEKVTDKDIFGDNASDVTQHFGFGLTSCPYRYPSHDIEEVKYKSETPKNNAKTKRKKIEKESTKSKKVINALEIYPGQNQSSELYPQYNDWIEKFFKVMIKKLLDYLAVGGVLALNLPSSAKYYEKKSRTKQENSAEPMLTMEEHLFKYIGKLNESEAYNITILANNGVYGMLYGVKTTKDDEGLFIFAKKELNSSITKEPVADACDDAMDIANGGKTEEEKVDQKLVQAIPPLMIHSQTTQTISTSNQSIFAVITNTDGMTAVKGVATNSKAEAKAEEVVVSDDTKLVTYYISKKK